MDLMTKSAINKHNSTRYILVCTLDDLRVAFAASSVERTIRMVEITPLPKSPQIVLGIINIHGMIIPVVNIRQRFRLPDISPEFSDSIIIVNSDTRKLGIVVDSVQDVIELDESRLVTPENIISGVEYIDGVLKPEDGMVLIHNINKFLSLEEENALNESLIIPSPSGRGSG